MHQKGLSIGLALDCPPVYTGKGGRDFMRMLLLVHCDLYRQCHALHCIVRCVNLRRRRTLRKPSKIRSKADFVLASVVGISCIYCYWFIAISIASAMFCTAQSAALVSDDVVLCYTLVKLGRNPIPIGEGLADPGKYDR